MPAPKLLFRSWLAERTADPYTAPPAHSSIRTRLISLSDLPAELLSTEDIHADTEDSARLRLIRKLVGNAIRKLSPAEREFIEQFYFRGADFHELSRRSGRSHHSLLSLQTRALKRLRKELAGAANQLYGIELPTNPTCIICRSKQRSKIDELLKHRDRTKTWASFISLVRKECGVFIKSPQTFISHEKYH